MTKHNGKYYMQYGAPATEFSGYSDGVYVSKSPFEGFDINNIIHSLINREVLPEEQAMELRLRTITRTGGTFSTIFISTKNNFERRLGIWRPVFDKDDVMYCNTAYGDYPTYLPQYAQGKDFTKGLLPDGCC